MIKIIFSFCLFFVFISGAKAQKPLEIRDSMLIIGNVYADSIAREDLYKIDSLIILDTINLTEIRYVTMYNLAFRTQGRYYNYVRVYGAKLSPRAKHYFKRIRKGDMIVIASIKYLDAGSKEIRFGHAVSIIVK